MNKKTFGILAVLLIAASSIGLISAHQDGEDNESWEEHQQEMFELHEQYSTGEITYEQFVEEMNEEMEEHGMPCRMGFGMMGMMW